MGERPRFIGLKLLRNLSIGIREEFERQVSEGQSPSEVLDRLKDNARKFGAFLLSPEFNIESLRLNQKTKKQALLEEISRVGRGFVYGRTPEGKEERPIIIDKFCGEEASDEIKNAKDPDLVREEGTDPETVQPIMITKSAYSIFGFISLSYGEGLNYNRDWWGREYSVSAYVLMPHRSANDLFQFILYEDANIIIDLYKNFFPNSSAVNNIVPGPGMLLKRDGENYSVAGYKI